MVEPTLAVGKRRPTRVSRTSAIQAASCKIVEAEIPRDEHRSMNGPSASSSGSSARRWPARSWPTCDASTRPLSKTGLAVPPLSRKWHQGDGHLRHQRRAGGEDPGPRRGRHPIRFVGSIRKRCRDGPHRGVQRRGDPPPTLAQRQPLAEQRPPSGDTRAGHAPGLRTGPLRGASSPSTSRRERRSGA